MAILEPLSYKQQKFCEEYLLSFNTYRAALSAGYSENTARKGDLLHVPKIQAYLKAAMQRSAARAELTHDMLLRELMKVAFCNMGNYYDDRGDPKRMHELTDDEKAAISYFHREDIVTDEGYSKGEVFKIKLHNKMAALDRLCKHTGFYKANWKALVEVDKSETEEDIAFEAECAKTEADGYSVEVSAELLGQLMDDVGGQKSDVGGSSESEEDCGEALQTQTQVKHSLQTSAGIDIECTVNTPLHLSQEGNRPVLSVDQDLDHILTLSPLDGMEDGKGKVEDGKKGNPNILTLSPLDRMGDGKDKMEDGKESNPNILTFSPVEVESRVESQEPGLAAGRWAAVRRPVASVAVG